MLVLLKNKIIYLVTGRGLLGRWGPNHASDPLITRWSQRQEKVLEIVLINRRDSGSLAFPGGMIDPGYYLLLTFLFSLIQ